MSTSSISQEEKLHRDLIDPVSYEPMTDAVTVLPCGHVLSEETVKTLQSRNFPCPLDHIPIEDFKVNHTVRNLVSDAFKQEPSEEAIATFEEGKILVNAEKYEMAIHKFLQLLNQFPNWEKPRNFIEFCLNRKPQIEPMQPTVKAPSPPPNPELDELVEAARKGNIEKLKQLIDQKTDVNQVLEDNLTALEWAAKEGERAVVMLLLDKGAKIDPGRPSGYTAFHAAASRDQNAIIKTLIDEGGELNCATRTGQTPLHIAASHGHLFTVKELTLRNANIDQVDQFGASALHHAAAEGHDEVVHYLISKRADIHLTKKDGNTALDIAFDAGHFDIVKRLAKKGTDLNRSRIDGKTLLHIAAEEGIEYKIQFLLKHGAKLEAADWQGQTPLHKAVQSEKNHAVKILLSNGADVNAIDSNGNCALDFAVKNDSSQMVKELTRYDIPLENRYNALMTGILCGKSTAPKTLLLTFPSTTWEGEILGTKGIGKVIADNEVELFRLFLDKGMDPFTILETNQGLIHWAAACNVPLIADILGKKGVGLDVQEENSGNTPLHYAAKENAMEMIQWLAESGVELDIKNKEGRTPMEAAIENSNFEAAKLILSAKKNEIEVIRRFIEPIGSKIAFGARDWNTYFGDVGKEPPLPPDIEEILQSPCSFWPEQKVSDTHFLCLIPKTINGNALTLDNLQELVKHPKQGNPTQYSYYWEEIQKEYGSKPVKNSYWVLMTKDVIPGSRNQTYEAQKALVEKTAPYEMPRLIEAATVIFMHTFKTGGHIYTDDKLGKQWTYTRCLEKYSKEQWPLAIGGLSAAGLGVYSYYCFFRDNCGVSGSRKF